VAHAFISRPEATSLEAESIGSPLSHAKAAVSWPAIFAGAFVAAAVSVILLFLGSGLGFASISPWASQGLSSTTFTIAAAIWLVITQWISAAFGGYIAGRLRTRWIGTHVHEIFFRDTAHGLITWAVATVLLAATVAASFSSVAGGGIHAIADAASGGARSAVSSPGSDYGIDRLFRAADPSAGPADSATGLPNANDPHREAAHIIANAVATGSMPDADRTYLADLVVVRTGVSQAEAQKRVDDFVAAFMQAEAKIKAEADVARKAASEAAIYTALSLLIGAFIASVAAALGGRLRDEHTV